MHKTNLTIVAAAVAAITAPTLANGLVSTDRFGYSGTIERFSSLSDAQSGTNAIDNITVGNRDLALFMANNDTQASDANIALGSWWYTTDSQGRAGFGNTRGNTGVGFMQLADFDSSTDTNVDMSFDNFDSNTGYYTDFHLSVEGENANRADDFSRLSAVDNVNDGGIWHEYAIDLTATGLQGQQIAPGVIESTNQPTGVSGTISAIFEITENQTSPANQGFYVVDFELSMINWAYENRDDLMTQDENGNAISDTFAPSTFRVVPMPTPLGLASAGLIGVAGIRRRR